MQNKKNPIVKVLSLFLFVLFFKNGLSHAHFASIYFKNENVKGSSFVFDKNWLQKASKIDFDENWRRKKTDADLKELTSK